MPKLESHLQNLWSGTIELVGTFSISLKNLITAGVGDLNRDFLDFLNWDEDSPCQKDIFIDKVISEVPQALLVQGLALKQEVKFEVPFQVIHCLLQKGQLMPEYMIVAFVRDRDNSLRLISCKWIEQYKFWKIGAFSFGHSPLPKGVLYIHG